MFVVAGVDNLLPPLSCVDDVEIGFFSKLSFLSPPFQMPAILLVTFFFGLCRLMPVLLLTGVIIGDFIDALLLDRNFNCETEVGRLEAFFGDVGVVGIFEDTVTRVGGFSFEMVSFAGDVGKSLTTGTFSSVGSS